MPKYMALIAVELDESTTVEAIETAESQVRLMEENAMTNGFAKVLVVLPVPLAGTVHVEVPDSVRDE